jgi:hypothetical protein
VHLHSEAARSPVARAAYAGIQKPITWHGTFDARTRGSIAAADRCQAAHTLDRPLTGLVNPKAVLQLDRRMV